MALRTFALDSIWKDDFSRSEWPKKTRGEAVQFIISAEPWIPFFTQRYGQLVELWSRDNGNDPPDIEAKFETKTVGFEITRLLPERIGRYDAHLEKFTPDVKVNMLNLSSYIPPTKEGVLNYALSNNGAAWASVETELKLWQEEARAQYEKKARGSGYDYVIMHASLRHIGNLCLNPLVVFLNGLVQENDAQQPALLVSNTCYGYNMSWMLEKGRAPIQHFTDKTYSKFIIKDLQDD